MPELGEHRHRFGRLGWHVAPLGVGTWGLGNWSGVAPDDARSALQSAIDRGCNFVDTAWNYGRGEAERTVGELLRRNTDRRIHVATKLPPLTSYAALMPSTPIDEVYPASHIREYAERSASNLGVDRIDLLQFHVWQDSWAHESEWVDAVGALKASGLVTGIGISVNRWEPTNVLETLNTGVVDAVQVIYNIFDQSPEDELLARCDELDLAVIARVPFDEGALTGTLSRTSTWEPGDWRNSYFTTRNLDRLLPRVDALRADLPAELPLAEAAVRFAAFGPGIDVTIAGMRSARHVEANTRAAARGPLDPELREKLASHRWDRDPDDWFGADR